MSKEMQRILARNIQDKYPDFNIIISDEEPYTLYCAKDLGKILKLININANICKYDKKYKILINVPTNGGKQNVIYLTYNGVLKILMGSRKPNVIDFCKLFNIDVETTKYICIETDTIKCISDAFNIETMILQHNVDKYYIDLYFPDYKLAIECDEHHYDIIGDTEREEFIKNKLDCKFIRYKPYDKDFNIFILIGHIYKYIIDYQKNTL
jgi:hypothetical protein